MPFEARLRPGAADDADRLSVLGAQVWMHTYATGGVSQEIAAYVLRELSSSAISATLADPTKHVAVAEVCGSLIGYAVLRYSNPCPQEPETQVELVTLHVQEHFSRRGVGSALLDYAERSAQSLASCLWLMVNAQNYPAIAFYRNYGYAQVGTAYFDLGGEKYENHVLTNGRR